MPAIELHNLSKAFGALRPLDGLSAHVPRGDVLALFGPSGSGKTTLLRLIAGFDRPDAGSIRFDDRVVSGDGVFVSPSERGVGMVFQDLALWPHMRAARQIDFVLRRHLRSKSERRQRVTELLGSLDLAGAAKAWPSELSGGERQRLALARALAPGPEILLLDEPFAYLDRPRVERVTDLIRRRKDAGATVIMAAHDERDVRALADSVLVMGEGFGVQVNVDAFTPNP